MSNELSIARVLRFIDDYARAFECLDVARIAALYCPPTFSISKDGLHVTRSEEDLLRNFESFTALLRGRGFEHTSREIITVRLLGQAVAECTVRWGIWRTATELSER